jgi:hypothetical protein
MAETEKKSLFPTIGSLANQTDQPTAQAEDGDQVVQEIPSLCMKCHEQVRVLTDWKKVIVLKATSRE